MSKKKALKNQGVEFREDIIRGGGRNGLQMVQDVCEKVTG